MERGGRGQGGGGGRHRQGGGEGAAQALGSRGEGGRHRQGGRAGEGGGQKTRCMHCICRSSWHSLHHTVQGP